MKENTEKFANLLKTPLFDEHCSLEAKIVDFGGWALPVNYGSQVDEHHAVRKNAGMFDVSHMTVSKITGPDTVTFLEKLLANDINKAASTSGKALYSCMLNEAGGVIDDLIVYFLSDQHCRLVTNAATNAKDMSWIKQHTQQYDVNFQELPELALIAVQGPDAISKVADTIAEFTKPLNQLKRFQGAFVNEDVFIGRTGYTGEDGIEIIIKAEQATTLWQQLIAAGIQPCGLGARDTLRLEAGMALYGNDLDEQHSPLESGLAWTVSLTENRDFIGKTALEKPAQYKMIGLVLEERGVLRAHQKVMLGDQYIGEITSGTYSPSLEQSIAMARVNISAATEVNQKASVEVRGKHLNCRIVKYPFYSNGKATF